MEQQREEVSSTFGWYFPGQILLKSIRGVGLLAAGCELPRSPWPHRAWCRGTSTGRNKCCCRARGGAAGEVSAAAFRWDAARACECTVLGSGASLQPSLNTGCQAWSQRLVSLG